MPLSTLSSLSRREQVFLVIALIAITVAGYLLWNKGAGTQAVEEAVAEKAAEDVAKAENPFSSDNPLAEVETNPFGKVKAVLNPFEE